MSNNQAPTPFDSIIRRSDPENDGYHPVRELWTASFALGALTHLTLKAAHVVYKGIKGE